ncbi:single-stranded DNA-binding protein [Bosea massiliensis]|uniref:Single-stranded DNA-binding protein n=1 Tax=Bosea massiliensis TaxID=151419 RepID=A0ABW0PBS7_9HYPH
MSSLNRATLIGRLGKDPEITRTGGGLMVAKFSIATSETWRDKQSGEKKEKTDWHNVVVFNENLAKIAEQYLKKGSLVLVEGKIVNRTWDKPDGGKGYATEIQLQGFDGKITMLGGKGDGGGGGRDYDSEYAERGGGRSSGNSGGSSSSGGFSGSGRASPGLDDDIPFGPEMR